MIALALALGLGLASANAAAAKNVRTSRRTCVSICVDDCNPFERRFYAANPDVSNSTVYGTGGQCVLSLPCYESQCQISSAKPLTSGAIERLVAAAKAGDARYITGAMKADDRLRLNVSRQSLQILGCGETVSLNVSLSPSLVASLGKVAVVDANVGS
jgi:hypothetical protein